MGGSPRRIFAVQILQAGSPTDEDKLHWILTVSEITHEPENMARIQFQERLTAVGQLAVGIAHDFNNIMAAILIFTDLLHFDDSIPATSQEKLEVIQQQVERASSLIRQILTFSRRSVMEQSILDLLPLLKEIDKMLARVLQETIQLELAYQPNAYWVNGDSARRQQVFMNLALNAKDAMPEGGKLHLELGTYSLPPGVTPPIPDLSPGNWIRIVISDTGKGIAPETRQHIFEPFFTTKPAGQGTGLGLDQVYGIVKQHEGHIDFYSQVGKGTSFSIYLPALDIQLESKSQPEPASLLNGEGQTALVVEDDTSTRQALQALLEIHGYQVLTASNGIEALKLIEQSGKSVGLVVRDIVMPDGGIALYRVFNKRSPKTKV